MWRLIATVAILSLAAPNLVQTISFGSDTKETKAGIDECLGLFGQVEDLPSLDTFLTSMCEKIHYGNLTRKEVSKCLGLSGDPTDIIFPFKNLVDRSQTGRFCDRWNTELLLEVQLKLAKMRDNKLTSWFEKFLRQAIQVCKQRLLHRLAPFESRTDYLVPVMRLASNFDWTNIDHFIKDDAPQSMRDITNLDEIPTSSAGSFEQLMRLDQLDKIYEKNSIAFSVTITHEQYRSLEKLLGMCDHLVEVKAIDLDPILNIIKLGYNDERLGLDAEFRKSLKSLDHLIVSIQMCAIVGHASFKKKKSTDSEVVVRLSMEQSFQLSVIFPKKETWQMVVGLGVKDEKSGFENFDQLEDLIVRDSKALENTLRKYKKESLELVEAVTSPRFLEVLAAYLQSL